MDLNIIRDWVLMLLSDTPFHFNSQALDKARIFEASNKYTYFTVGHTVCNMLVEFVNHEANFRHFGLKFYHAWLMLSLVQSVHLVSFIVIISQFPVAWLRFDQHLRQELHGRTHSIAILKKFDDMRAILQKGIDLVATGSSPGVDILVEVSKHQQLDWSLAPLQ